MVMPPGASYHVIGVMVVVGDARRGVPVASEGTGGFTAVMQEILAPAKQKCNYYFPLLMVFFPIFSHARRYFSV